jgi:phosphatidate cytidylyltransferase
MLKHRLLFGSLMLLFFIGVVIFDSWLDGSLTACTADDKPVQGSILCLLIALLVIPAQIEFAGLIAPKNLKIFTPLAIPASIMFATAWYWTQIINLSLGIYLAFLSAFTLFALLFYQYLRFGISSAVANCSVNYFSIIYLGLLSAFVLAIRIEFGIWHLLMFILVVKSADIGAYTLGRICGKHKFSPNISPKKTWEGMLGAIIAATIVALLFALTSGIIIWQLAVVFGICFAFIGQLGDLAESLIKRDAQQKDSSNSVPGFGGILDVIDSPLAAACFAYLFFLCCSG